MPTTSTDPRAAAAALLVPGTTCHGFAVERCETVPELDSDAYVLRHTASGARLLYLACDDENKAFAIGFKTPPADSTGVFHILEHSVLCGSAKFPVKEPFVDLIKSSMQTFLNAMTYPDKTIYPVATTNEQDLYNLMDVYLDAVFNPAIYTKPTIFEQEGWHYELDLPEDVEGEGGVSSASLREGTLRYNGVVFNEMKGALSDPMSVLDDAVNAALYPDTAYARESGGDPRAIPALTYEQFLDTHARHYNPSNSYITLYGDLDVDRALAFLDERYLSQPSAASRRMDAAVAAGEDPSTLAPNPLGVQAPVTCEYKRVEMDTTPENALVGLGLVLGSALDRKRTIAADILFEALLGSNEAPVKKAILAAGLGGNVVSYTAAESLQPYELIMLQNAQPGVARELRRVFQDACRDLCEHGVPRERLEAIISSNEYDLRQRDYGIADGVAIACDALSTWLYDDDAATLALKYGPVYEELRGELDGSYFEDLLRELVLENDHMALVELVPVDAAEGVEGAEAAELATKRDAMTDAELADVVERTGVLRAAQEAEDTPEDKATLPRLRVSDIGAARPEPPLVVDTTAPIPCLRHGIPTNRLAYAMQYFDLSCVAFEDLPYVTLLCRLLKQLPTREHSAEELDNLLAGKLGFLSFTTEVMTQPDVDGVRPYLLVSAGALSEKIDALASLPWTVEEFAQVSAQFENLASVPNYPGSYIIDRYTNFAFLSAFNDKANPSEALLQYISTINKEIERKRDEFNLETLTDGKDEYKNLLTKRKAQMDFIQTAIKQNKDYSASYDALLDQIASAVKSDNAAKLMAARDAVREAYAALDPDGSLFKADRIKTMGYDMEDTTLTKEDKKKQRKCFSYEVYKNTSELYTQLKCCADFLDDIIELSAAQK